MITRRTAAVGAAGLLSAAIIGSVVTAGILNSRDPQPQEVRIVQETGEPTPEPSLPPSAEPDPIPTPSPIPPSPIPAPKMACTKNAPANSICSSPAPQGGGGAPVPKASTRG